jgi:thiol-disulfide isomerase/thioredoxin
LILFIVKLKQPYSNQLKNSKMRRELLLILIFTFSASISSGQTGGHRIEIRSEGLAGEELYFAYHMGNRQFISDTVTINEAGVGLVSGDEPLPGGVYILVLPEGNYFEILVDETQHFIVEFNTDNPGGTLSFTGSEENSRFASFQKNWMELNTSSQRLRERLNANNQNRDSTTYLSELAAAHEIKTRDYVEGVVSENRGTLLGALVAAMAPAPGPVINVPPDAENPDSLRWVLMYNNRTNSYFDNFDISDERLLRSPIFHGKISQYFTQTLLQHPDTLIKGIDKVLSLTGDNPETFRYISIFLFNHFRESTIMGHDAVLVKIADEVYLSGKAHWASQEFIDNLRKDVDRLRPSLIGNRAMNLTMETHRHGTISLHDIEAEYTVIYFWEPDCGHCKEATPLLHDFYQRNRDKGVELFTIGTTPVRDAWEKYIEENDLTWINGWDPQRSTHYDFFYNVVATPMIYILDSDKRIIAKRLGASNVEDFIDNHRRYSR